MSFDSSGTFSRIASGGAGGDGAGSTLWQGDAAAGTKILASRHDSHDQDIANGLSQTLLRNGKGVPTADIPWGGKKITNMATPTQPQDAATKNYVDKLPGWDTAKNISGANLDGRLNFTATSGVNGITWTYVDVSWVARHSEASKTSRRLVMNNTKAPNTTGDAVGDVFIIDDGGRINNSGVLTNNLSWDGSSWRAISPGVGTRVSYGGGEFALASNDVATITNNYAVATQREYFRAANTAGVATVDLIKSASGKFAAIRSFNGTELRWQMIMGNGTAESATRTGSDFYLQSYDNSGLNPVNEFTINRSTHLATFVGAITSGGTITSANNFDSTSAICIVSATTGGSVFIRPDGPTTTTSSTRFDTSGNLLICEGVVSPAPTGGILAGKGIRGKIGSGTGAYDSEYMNFSWTGSNLVAYADTSSLGNVTVSCDYRIKKDIQPLGSTWEKVKALNPISYTQKAYEIWTEDDTPRWGFMAHELQERLFEGAASGVKDGPDVQSPNLLAIIAGLTRALQEAMARIEALEAAA